MPDNTTVTELKHFGIKGMQWGVRNYQNRDGGLTPLGILRYQKKSNGGSKLFKSVSDVQSLTEIVLGHVGNKPVPRELNSYEKTMRSYTTKALTSWVLDTSDPDGGYTISEAPCSMEWAAKRYERLRW